MDFRSLQLAGLGGLSVMGFIEGFFEQPDWSKPRPPAHRRPGQTLPNVALTTHTGARVRFYDDLVRGKLVVITMMYAGCSNTCPPTTRNLLQVQQMLGDRVGRDIFMYSITLRPDQDSPQELAHYARLHGVGPGWLFLTGAAPDIEQLRYALGFYDPDPKIDREEGRHVGMVRVGNDSFRRWGMAPALAEPRQIVATIQHLDRRKPSAAG